MPDRAWAWLGGADIVHADVLMRWASCGLAGRVLIAGKARNALALCATRGEALAAALAATRATRERLERELATARADERQLRRELAREAVADLPFMLEETHA